MALENTKALVRETVAFVKKETAFGELAFPAAADAIRVVGVPTLKQAESFTDNPELVDSRSKPERVRDITPAGDFDIKMICRPSGAAGTAPAEDVLVECALGKKTINAGTSVVYEPALVLPSFSFFFKEGHTWNFAAGLKVGALSLDFSSKGYLNLGFTGLAKKVLKAGTSETIAGSTTTVIKLASGDAHLFSVGSYVQVGGDDNGGAGYEVTGRDLSADTITISPALALAPDPSVAVTGFLPTPTFSGVAVAARTGAVTLDGADLKILSGQATLNNNNVADDAELTSDQFIGDIAEGVREVTGRLECRFRRQYAAFFSRAREQVQGAIVLQAGDTAGAQVKWELPQAEMNTPDLGEDSVWRNITVEMVGMPTTTLEDEIKLTYL